jgi:hypothetical protein
MATGDDVRCFMVVDLESGTPALELKTNPTDSRGVSLQAHPISCVPASRVLLWTLCKFRQKVAAARSDWQLCAGNSSLPRRRR